MRRMYSKPQLLEAVEQEAEVNGLKAFENIVDKDGHKRFIDGVLPTKELEGLVYTYNKWSLSGSHLLLVIAGTIANATVIANGFYMLQNFNLPEWIMDKIYPTYSNVVDVKTITLYGGTSQTISVYFNKGSSGLSITVSGITDNADKQFKIAFDLLIDNE